MTRRTEREQNIEQVAGIIVAGYITAEVAEEVNDGDGWTFEVRYDTQEYVSGSNYTRVENLSLAEEDLQLAIRLAQVWEYGDSLTTARDLETRLAAQR